MFLIVFILPVAAGGAAATSKNLWVSGLSSTTRATDLKTLFSKYGKVSPHILCLCHQDFSPFYFNIGFFPHLLGSFSSGCRCQGGDQCQEPRCSLLWLCHHVFHRGGNKVHQSPSQDWVAWKDDLCGEGESILCTQLLHFKCLCLLQS